MLRHSPQTRWCLLGDTALRAVQQACEQEPNDKDIPMSDIQGGNVERASTTGRPRRRGACSYGKARPTTTTRADASAELAFWKRLEEREEGRIAQEADHLFDTSFEWAA
jgi:hypothetical protein